MARLTGKTALVSGGNTGIGRAISLAYADEGADVAIAWYEREQEAHSLAEKIRESGQKALVLHCDVTQERDVIALFSQVIASFGKLDILVNNAGIQKAQSIVETSVAEDASDTDHRWHAFCFGLALHYPRFFGIGLQPVIQPAMAKLRQELPITVREIRAELAL